MTWETGKRSEPARARLEIRGADTKEFLNRLTSNDVASLVPGEGRPTLLLERTGRFVDRLIACDLGDHILLLGSRDRADAVREGLGKYVITEDIEILDRAEELHWITVCGSDAAARVSDALGVDCTGLPRFAHRALPHGGIVIRAEDIAEQCFHLLWPTTVAVPAAVETLPELDDEEWRARRVVSGIPEFGEEFGDRTIALEPRMTDAISFTKGCYVGQEIVARLHHHKRVKWGLARVRIPGEEVPASGTPFRTDEEEVGAVASAVLTAEGVFALGYLKVAWLAPGTRLELAPEGAPARSVEVLTLTPAGDPE
jgi:folate-binding protein YgfZ